MSLPFLKKMKSWQNLWHLSLKYWWSVRSKSKKTGRNVFFWEKAKLSDSLLVVCSSKCSAVLKFRNIIKWQTVTPCDIKSMVLIRGWRRKWQPTPVFLPGESQGQRRLAGYSPWGRKESEVTQPLSNQGVILPPGSTRQRLEMFLVVTPRAGVAVTPSE